MLLEKINALEDSAFSFHLYHIHSTSISMHSAYEIIFILKGSVDLKCTAFHYHLKEGDIFIVNVKELHMFSNGSKDNLILVFHFNPYLYLHIFPKLNYYLFVCSSFSSDKKNDPKLLALQQMLLQLAVSVFKKRPDHNIEEQILSIITHLLNHFQSFSVKPQGYHKNESLESNDYQLQRICEIQEYLYVNAKNKIQLDNLAEHLHLNKYYVSHLIKNTIGLSMTDFLNLTRVELSEVLLLSTELSIEQIAFECGFSARRYFEKQFTKWYGISPSEYRQLHLNGTNESYEEFDLSYIMSGPGREIIHPYLYQESPASEGTFLSFEVSMADLDSVLPFRHFWEPTINISNPYSCARILSPDIIKESMSALKYSSARIRNIFAPEMLQRFSPEQLATLLDLFVNAGVTIIIHVTLSEEESALFSHAFQCFFNHVRTRYSSNILTEWKIEIEKTSSDPLNSAKAHHNLLQKVGMLKQYAPDCTFIIANPEKDSSYYSHDAMLLAPHIIKSCLDSDSETPRVYREFCESALDMEEGVTYPYPSSCLLTPQHEKKPLYYLWQMLSRLGDQEIQKETGMIITKRGNSFYVLIYDPFNQASSNSHSKPFAVRLSLSDITKKYYVTETYLDASCSLFQQRSALQFPSQLPADLISDINCSTAPTVKLHLLNPQKEPYTLNYQLNPYSVLLLSFIEASDYQTDKFSK